jgi:hypothetical protein
MSDVGLAHNCEYESSAAKPRSYCTESSLALKIARGIFMRIALLLGCLALGGCAVNTVNTSPTVDMRGVDSNKYADDLAACQEQARNGGFIQLGAPVSKCLEERGYHVTQRLS